MSNYVILRFLIFTGLLFLWGSFLVLKHFLLNEFSCSGNAKDVEDDILDKFYEYQKKADIYYAYHAIAKYMVSVIWQKSSVVYVSVYSIAY